MHYQHLTLALLLLCQVSCNAAGGKINGSVASKSGTILKTDDSQPTVQSKPDGTTYSTESGTDGIADRPGNPNPLPVNSTVDETVLPPSPITGALLFCQDIQNADLPKHKKEVGCSLKNDDARKNNRDLSGTKSHKWSFASNETTAELTRDQPNSAGHQAVFLVTAKNKDSSTFINAKLKVTLNYVEQNNDAFEGSTNLELQILRWVPLNNKAIPANALVAGTENNGAYQSPVCRYHYGNQLIPGKVQTDFKGGSVCFGSVDGKYITTGETYYDTDVLISDVDSTQFFEWVTTTNGVIPELAFQGGRDATGKAVFVCRGNMDRDGKPYAATAQYPNGQPSPGYAKNDGKGCTWQYYDVVTGLKFEVLVWKSDAVRKMMK